MSEGPAPEPDTRPGKSALGADLVIPLLAAAFTIYFLVTSASLVWEARANGTVVGVALLIMVAIQLARVGLQVRKGRASLSLGELAGGSTAQIQRLMLLLVLVVFVATVPWLGTTLGLFLVMIASMWTLGVRRAPTLLGIAFAVSATVYVLFIAILQSRLPAGPVEHALSSIRGAL
jgi:hypothetical protein